MQCGVGTVFGLREFARCIGSTGQLVWRRHSRGPLPTHHVLRSSCMQLLPLVETYCKWELQEDCNDLRSLLLRFDDESELETHELGRSLLCMLRDDDVGVPVMPTHTYRSLLDDPFVVARERLAAARLAISELQTEVHIITQN